MPPVEVVDSLTIMSRPEEKLLTSPEVMARARKQPPLHVQPLPRSDAEPETRKETAAQPTDDANTSTAAADNGW